ncbi:MAG: hypothetical protein PHY92_07750 [Alphaproteobacteria bacterium]|nr:hypothetical protein [Alphaproteobacteria bacterium]
MAPLLLADMEAVKGKPSSTISLVKQARSAALNLRKRRAASLAEARRA